MGQNKNEEYFKNLINEALLRLIPEAKLVMGDDDDDDDDDAFNPFAPKIDPNSPNLRKNVDFSKGPKIRGAGDPFQAAKTSVDRATADGSLDKPGPAQMAHRVFVDPNVKNKANKYDRDTNDPDLFGRIKVGFSLRDPNRNYPDGKFCMVSLFNIDPQDVLTLYKRFNKKGYTAKVNTASSRVNFGKDAVTFIVYEKLIDLWKENDLPAIIDTLRESPAQYDAKELDNLSNYIDNRTFTDKSIGDYFHASEMNNMQQMRQYLESEDDTEMNAILSLYQRSGALDYVCQELNLPDSYGHILSWKNAKAIMGSSRNATFVLPEKTWRDVFGRVVNPNAKPFMVRVPNSHNRRGKWKNPTSFTYTYKDKNGQDKSVFLSSTEDILNTFYGGKPYDSLDPQQRFFVNCLANVNNVRDTFIMQEYDVADTQWDPNLKPVDVFKETIGLTNNLMRGELNDKAIDALNKRDSDIANMNAEFDKISDETPDNPEDTDTRLANIMNATKQAAQNAIAYANANKIKFNQIPGDNSSTLINVLLAIAIAKIPSEVGVTRQNFVQELAENAVYFVCRMEKISIDRLNSFRHIQKVTDEELAKFSNVVDILVDAVEGTAINTQYKTALEEAVGGGFLQNLSANKELLHKKLYQFMKKLASEADANMMNENFNTLLNRMDDSKKNLLY